MGEKREKVHNHKLSWTISASFTIITESLFPFVRLHILHCLLIAYACLLAWSLVLFFSQKNLTFRKDKRDLKREEKLSQKNEFKKFSCIFLDFVCFLLLFFNCGDYFLDGLWFDKLFLTKKLKCNHKSCLSLLFKSLFK